jgi:HD-like signal output (HDOD) protein
MMGYPSYRHYLRSDHWQNIKRRFKRDRCELCGSIDRLDLHHRCYDNLGSEWAAPHQLITVCRFHHDKMHRLAKRNKCTIAKATRTVVESWEASQAPPPEPAWGHSGGFAQLVRERLGLA